MKFVCDVIGPIVGKLSETKWNFWDFRYHKKKALKALKA
jgi:hypothetical protein